MNNFEIERTLADILFELQKLNSNLKIEEGHTFTWYSEAAPVKSKKRKRSDDDIPF